MKSYCIMCCCVVLGLLGKIKPRKEMQLRLIFKAVNHLTVIASDEREDNTKEEERGKNPFQQSGDFKFASPL